jgi:hypothetical protein
MKSIKPLAYNEVLISFEALPCPLKPVANSTAVISNRHFLRKHFCFSGLPSEFSPPMEDEESKSGLDVMPNISDVLLRKLRVHKSLSGR